MSNWSLLTEVEYKRVWDFVYNDLHFFPNVREANRLIDIPSPSRHFNISQFYGDGYSEELYEDFSLSAISWFKKIAGSNRMYALNWQHECYSFRPDRPFEKDEFDEWIIPIFPNGDYLFFLTCDFRNGIFADGINLTISFWGKDLIEAFNARKAKMLE